jgi:hypothetical protein
VIGEDQPLRDRREKLKRLPDPRMNLLSEHFHRLSLGRLLLSSSVVTRATGTGLHCLLVRLSACIGCNICLYQGLFVPSAVETAHSPLAGSLHVVTVPSDSIRPCYSTSTASVLEFSNLETPSSWPASSIPTAIRCVIPNTLSGFKVLAGTPPSGTLLLLPALRPPFYNLPANASSMTA